MSKTITIPEYKNPFTVIINNKVYVYKGGETAEVPDDVAEAIEDAIELIPEPQRYLSRLAQRTSGKIAEVHISDLDGIETIVSYAFRDCRNLIKITIPDSVTSIGAWAFANCTSLPSVNIPNGVVSISESTFYGCQSLRSIEIPGNVTSVGENAFTSCKRLEEVYLPKIPPTLANVNAFSNISANCVFYCKTQASKEAYISAPIWSELASTYSFVVEDK